jgi:presequence protease
VFQQVGGAYGGFSDFDSHSGMYTYLSYRDPNVLKTVESYDGTPDFLRSLELDSDSLTKAIIGTIGDIDSYQLPDSKVHDAVDTTGHVSVTSWLQQRWRPEDMRQPALHVFPQGYTAFMRHVLNVTDEERQQRREQVLGTTLKDFRCLQPVDLCAGCMLFEHSLGHLLPCETV